MVDRLYVCVASIAGTSAVKKEDGLKRRRGKVDDGAEECMYLYIYIYSEHLGIPVEVWCCI